MLWLRHFTGHLRFYLTICLTVEDGGNLSLKEASYIALKRYIANTM
jgi:hypothetical protein